MFHARASSIALSLASLAGCAGMAATPAPRAPLAEAAPAPPAAPAAAEPAALPQNAIPADGRWHGDLDLLVGVRGILDDGWDPGQGQGVLGIQFALRPPRSMVGIELGAAISADENEAGPDRVDVSSRLSEMWVGPQLAIGDRRKGNLDVFVGAGVTYLGGETERLDLGGMVVSDSDTAVAGYAHAGVAWRLTRRLRLGLDLRGVFGADMRLHGEEADPDYLQAALLLGVGW
jgi:hypothetical protein